ncbi:hypothetical protein NQZ68_002089 [Dissostichus eleginoides]|nr:hypothetical protein NQZ68_002089 [Dissostichus eleginoides]
MTFKKLNKQLSNLDKVKVELVRLTVFAQEETKDLEAQPVPDVDKQKQEIDACRAEKKTKADELATIKQKHAEIAANLKSESDAWEQEIQSLKSHTSGYRPICDHVKKVPLAVKLCGTKNKPVDKGEKAS